jgi:hypothetical protein
MRLHQPSASRHRDQDTATQQTRRATCIREGPHGARSGVVRRLQQLWLTKLQTRGCWWAYGAAVKIIAVATMADSLTSPDPRIVIKYQAAGFPRQPKPTMLLG